MIGATNPIRDPESTQWETRFIVSWASSSLPVFLRVEQRRKRPFAQVCFDVVTRSTSRYETRIYAEKDSVGMTKTITSERAPEPVGAYPHAKQVGSLLFLSGLGPRKRGSKDIPGVTLDGQGNIVSYDIAEQCRSVFTNVRAVVEEAGSSWENIVDVTVFLTNMKADFAIYNGLYAEYFAGPGNPNPTRTTLEINCLPTPIAIELKVMATMPE